MVRKTCILLPEDQQAKWALLSSSISHKFDYHLALQYPSNMVGPARHLNRVIWQMLESAAGLHIPTHDEGLGVECCPLVPVPGL